MTYTLLIFSGFLEWSAAGILFLIWWPLRKTDIAKSLPWYFSALVLNLVISCVFMNLRVHFDGALHASGINVGSLVMGTMALGGFIKFLCSILLIANGAFLLDRLGYSGKMIQWIKALYVWTTPLGIALLVTTAFSRGVLPLLLYASVWKK